MPRKTLNIEYRDLIYRLFELGLPTSEISTRLADVGLKRNHTALYEDKAKWKQFKASALEKDSIDDFVEFTFEQDYRLTNIRVDSLQKIRRSIAWIQSNTLRSDYPVNETYRYMKWADHILDATGNDITNDLDLWALSKNFARRERLMERGHGNLDGIADWLSHRPYIKDNEEGYLHSLQNGYIQGLDEESVFDYDYTVTLPYGDSYMYAQNLCNIGDTKYLLPTQQITEFREGIPIQDYRLESDIDVLIGDPTVYRITGSMGA